MNLYLVRHAEPKREEEDRQRPLSERGWSEIRKVTAFISDHYDIQVRTIHHSGKTRARQTAEALAELLNPPEGILEIVGLKPLDDTSIWVERLVGEEEDIMLVGHLPYLDRLSKRLLSQNESRKIKSFQTGEIVCLKRDESATWSVQWMVNPQILPA